MAAITWIEETGATKEYHFEGDELSIGRDSSCDLCLTAGSVSRYHATIRKEGDQFVVVDSSTNGTMVDNVLLQKGDTREIDEGSVIVVGDTTLNFRIAEEGRTMLLPEKKPPRIVLLKAGKPAGEFPIGEDELYIGSDESNDIVLTGTYVSRKHARIVPEGEAFVIIDSSSNGTFVNAERITEHELEDGDSIKIVDHEMQFVISEVPGKIPSPAADKDKKRRIRVLALACAAAVLLVLIGLMATMSSTGKKGPSPGTTPPPVPPTFGAVLQEADALIAQERWDEAMKKLESVKTTDSAYLGAQRKMQAIRSEIKCIEAKPEILRLIGEENFVEAGNLLKGIPQASNCAESVRLEFEARLAEFCESNVKLAREKLDLEGAEQAKPFVDKVLAAMPEHQEGLQLAKVIEGKIADDKRQTTGSGTAPPSGPDPGVEKNKEIARQTYNRAIQAYLEGSFSSAASSMRKIASLKLPYGDSTKARAARGAEILRDAKSRYESGKAHYNGGNTTGAYAEWNKFLALNKQLDPNRKGRLYGDVADKMTATYCGFASEKYKREDYAGAFEWWWKAKQVDPDNAAAKEGIAALEKHAIKKYREGYMFAGRGSVEAAAKCFNEVMQILPSNHEYYIKAQKKMVDIGQ